MTEKNSEENLVILLEVANTTEADLIRSVLWGSGIESFVQGESFGQTFAGVLGMKIMVRAVDLERAKELLRAREERF